MINSKQLAKSLYEMSKENIPNLDAKFFDFIEKRNLKAQLPSILYHLEKIEKLDKEKNSVEIEVAHEIKDDTLRHVKSFLKVENMPEIVKNKKELIGGFRAKWNGVIYDASISTSLKKLKETIIR